MDWTWSRFLGRPDPPVDYDTVAAAVKGRRVLVTGAGGSIGRCLAETVLGGDPKILILSDLSEHALYEVFRNLSDALPGTSELVPVLGDVLDPQFLRTVLRQHRPDLIFHTAAYKHVPLLERNPFAAIRNNAVGTFHLAKALTEEGGCDLLLLSTDKAVEPISIMGASKRIAELAVLAHSGIGSNMSVLRLSNVLHSSGSVVPLFAEQLQQGISLTVTHTEVRRFLMTSNEAARASLIAVAVLPSARVLVPPSTEAVAILDLARYMSDRYRTECNVKAAISNEAEIEIIGLRPGEKLMEKLTSENETLEQALPSGLQVFRSPFLQCGDLDRMMADLERAVNSLDESAMLLALAALVPEYKSTLWQGDPTPQPIGLYPCANS